jgi:hypothetical protein
VRSNFFTPITGSVQPRFAGVASLMRLLESWLVPWKGKN